MLDDSIEGIIFKQKRQMTTVTQAAAYSKGPNKHAPRLFLFVWKKYGIVHL